MKNKKIGTVDMVEDPGIGVRYVDHRGQTKLGSIVEAIANIIFGFGVAVWANTVVLPWFGFKCSTHQALGIGLIFTGISFVRSYIFRRIFNWITLRFHL